MCSKQPVDLVLVQAKAVNSVNQFPQAELSQFPTMFTVTAGTGAKSKPPCFFGGVASATGMMMGS